MTRRLVVLAWRCPECGTWSELETRMCPACSYVVGEAQLGLEAVRQLVAEGEVVGGQSIDLRGLDFDTEAP